MQEITQHFSDVNRCHTVRLNRAHAEYRSETLSLDVTFLVIGRCNTKWILDTYRAVVTWIHGDCFSVQLLDFVNMDMYFRITKRKCNWRDCGLSLDVFELMGFYSALVVRFYRRFGTSSLSWNGGKLPINGALKKKYRRPKKGVKNSWANISFKEGLFSLELFNLANYEVTYR
jgi:hypothetical protein